MQCDVNKTFAARTRNILRTENFIGRQNFVALINAVCKVDRQLAGSEILIRIEISPHGSRTVDHVFGRLFGSSVEQLKKASDPIEGLTMIDLSHLLLANKDGINAIRSLADKGAQI